jgi:acyl transferase domain-containing protein
VPVVLSAHADELLAGDAEAILQYLPRNPEVSAVAATLLRTRRLRRHRAVLCAADITELADGLRAVSTGTEHPSVVRSSETATTRTAFVFPGQGAQKVGMGRALSEAFPESRAVFAEADAAVGFALSALCFEGPEEDLRLTANTQPAILATSVAAPAKNRAEFEKLLKQALAIDVSKRPQIRLANLIAQRRARFLLATADRLFK